MIFSGGRSRPTAPRAVTGRKRGQSMVEFALVAPIFFFLLFGVLEFGLMMFDVTTTRFAAGEAARVEAQVGIQSTDCTTLPGCGEIYGPGYLLLYTAQGCDAVCRAKSPTPPPLCDADCQGIVAAHRTALGSTHLERINYVDVQKVTFSSGTNSFAPVVGVCQRYNWDGSAYLSGAPAPDPGPCSNYPGSGRGVAAGSMDYIQVNINFTYKWLTGMFAAILKSPTLDSKFIVRLEPQQFTPPGP